jgi:hypothetical protein
MAGSRPAASQAIPTGTKISRTLIQLWQIARLGDTIGALINVTFGNAVELIIFIIALVKNEIRRED